MSHLGRSNPSRGSPSRRREGGEVNLPSRERKEVGKGNALDHPSPEGWWDSAEHPLRSKPQSVKSVLEFRPSWGYLGGLWGISWASFGRPEPPPGAPNRVINLTEVQQKHPLRSKPRSVKMCVKFPALLGPSGSFWGVSRASFGGPHPPPGTPNRAVHLTEIQQKQPLRSKPRSDPRRTSRRWPPRSPRT